MIKNWELFILTVAIITKNEENNIVAALQSAAFADELLVIDSGSTDKTIELAIDSGARVVEMDWNGHIVQKNRALEMASCPWVFHLDADERFTPELAQEVLKVVRLNPKGIAYKVKRENWIDGSPIRFGRMSRDFPIRLLRRGEGVWRGLDPHDALQVNVSVKALKSKLLHYSYAAGQGQRFVLERYSAIAAHSLYENGKHAGFVDIGLRPVWSFFRDWIIYLGILEGRRGFKLACSSARYTFLKWRQLRDLQKKK